MNFVISNINPIFTKENFVAALNNLNKCDPNHPFILQMTKFLKDEDYIKVMSLESVFYIEKENLKKCETLIGMLSLSENGEISLPDKYPFRPILEFMKNGKTEFSYILFEIANFYNYPELFDYLINSMLSDFQSAEILKLNLDIQSDLNPHLPFQKSKNIKIIDWIKINLSRFNRHSYMIFDKSDRCTYIYTLKFYDDNKFSSLTLEEIFDTTIKKQVFDFYENENLWVQRSYLDGKLDGPFISWHKNGQICVESLYTKDVRNGQYKEYNKDGIIIKESFYDLANLQVKKNSYYDDGCIKSTTQFKSDYGWDTLKLDGKQLCYHRNGIMSEEIYYDNGIRVGIGTFWHPNGQIRVKEICENGRAVEQIFYKNGKPTSCVIS